MFEDSARKGLTSITGPLIWTCSFYDDSARQKCVVCKAEPHYWKSHLSFSVFGHFDSSFSHLNQHAFTHPSTQWSSHALPIRRGTCWLMDAHKRHPPLPSTVISRTLSQHLLELWWLYGLCYYCLPSSSSCSSFSSSCHQQVSVFCIME